MGLEKGGIEGSEMREESDVHSVVLEGPGEM